MKTTVRAIINDTEIALKQIDGTTTIKTFRSVSEMLAYGKSNGYSMVFDYENNWQYHLGIVVGSAHFCRQRLHVVWLSRYHRRFVANYRPAVSIRFAAWMHVLLCRVFCSARCDVRDGAVDIASGGRIGSLWYRQWTMAGHRPPRFLGVPGEARGAGRLPRRTFLLPVARGSLWLRPVAGGRRRGIFRWYRLNKLNF